MRKFEEGRTHQGALSPSEAALGVSERTFRRWRDRYEAGGAEGDRRLGRVSARRTGADEVAQVLELTRYAKHFHEKAPGPPHPGEQPPTSR